MGDVTLHGILNMPPKLWDDSPIDQAQRHSRYVEASARIRTLEGMIKNLNVIRHGVRHLQPNEEIIVGDLVTFTQDGSLKLREITGPVIGHKHHDVYYDIFRPL